MLSHMNEACRIAKLPLQEQPQAWEDWKDALKLCRDANAGQKRLILATLLMPAMDRVAMAYIQGQARFSCALGGLAAERFRLVNKRWPKDLQELCPTYLKEIPIDPFDGKPLKFALQEDGIVIYSVDKDGQDDGGDIHKQSPDADNPKDLGVRLYNPKNRRLPPLPMKQQPNGDDDDRS